MKASLNQKYIMKYTGSFLDWYCQSSWIILLYYHILSSVSGASSFSCFLLNCGCGRNVEAFFTFWVFIFGNFVVASLFLIVVDVVVDGWEMTEGEVTSTALENKLSVPWFELGLLLTFLWFWNILLRVVNFVVLVVGFCDEVGIKKFLVVTKTSCSESFGVALVGDFVFFIVLWDVVAFLICLVVSIDLRVDVVGCFFNLGLTWLQDLNNN